jgi:hypothetical protein
MELESVHKYALNILFDFKPEESPLRSEGEAAMKRRAAERLFDNVCHGEYGWPVAGLLAEPFKIVQAAKETMILYEVDGLRRQVFMDGRQFPRYLRISGISSDIPPAAGTATPSLLRRADSTTARRWTPWAIPEVKQCM